MPSIIDNTEIQETQIVVAASTSATLTKYYYYITLITQNPLTKNTTTTHIKGITAWIKGKLIPEWTVDDHTGSVIGITRYSMIESV